MQKRPENSALMVTAVAMATGTGTRDEQTKA